MTEFLAVAVCVGLYLLTDVIYWKPNENLKKAEQIDEETKAYYPYMDEADVNKIAWKRYRDYLNNK